ncbi:acyl transferase/acyl hydrolase/lysophospholipase [Talaromyces proteolyticus]|uniref:Acyl transferase/acyl hydrolase/lysophospholipase n=1 Tax=Talaromyces proteolyticus TaxID=1131652 RepID=A0AAD4KNA7_9EURO|nr:acyl transferase/acyl hydrolase/lysophospholipase [Talaromyces proteolyticus]KAH8695949.1 acyl transferase/acyl hydrolase/lysophospholipase [Talaromyces proteolyticus]
MENSQLRRKDTTKGPPLRVLSLDGGGVRGYSMLILLQELMYRTYVECEGQAPRRDQIPKPCDYFDLIVGTGTGGLIAIMLGRLRLDLETCKEMYVRMTKRVFETDKTIAGIPYRSTLFKASRLEEAIRQCVREHTIYESEGNDVGNSSTVEITSPVNSIPQRTLSRSSMSSTNTSRPPPSPKSQRNSVFLNGFRFGNPDAALYDNREYRTKMAVTAMYKGSRGNVPPVLLRSYDSRREPPPEFECTIWQAGRATSATGLAFKPIQIGQHVFIDEGAGNFNPAPVALDEAVLNEWPGREVGVFVSVGTGKRPSGTNHRQHEWWEDFVGDALGTFAEARRRLIAKIEGCEETHQQMLKEYLAKRNVKQENYYRLNVEVGVGEFGMNEWNRLADISTNTRRYLSKSEVQRMTLDAASKLARIERMHRRLASHSAAMAQEPSRQEPAFEFTPTPTVVVPPPSNPAAVELPAEDVAVGHRPHGTGVHSRVSDEKIAIMGPDEFGPSPGSLPVRPASQDAPAPRRSGEYRPSPSSGSPRRSGDLEAHVPPPLPPKTPIPYPDDGGSTGISMPLPGPPRMAQSNPSHPRPPYPVDGPPAVNKLRKPTYNVR